MMIHRRVWINFTICAMGVFLYGCLNSATPSAPTPFNTPSVEQMDKSLFTGIPCTAPCWQMLEVGKSTESDVLAAMPRLTFIDRSSIQTSQVSMPGISGEYGSGILIRASCVNSKQQCLSLAVVDHILTNITIGINYEIGPQEAIAYLGNPDYVGYDNLGAEKVMCEVYLVWRDSRLVLATRFEDIMGAKNYCYVVRDEGKVPTSLDLLEARFLSEAELNAKLKTGTGKFFEYSGVFTEK